MKPTTTRGVWLLAVIYFVLEWAPGSFGSYGYFIDELYYLACADRLAFGYVDHPPLSILILRGVRTLLGSSLPVLRLVPAAAGGLTVVLTAVMARRLGAGRFGQLVAAGAVMIGAINHILFSLYSMNALLSVLWALACLVLIEIERRGDPRWWMALGLVAGLALETKHTFVLFLGGLFVGLVATPARRHLRSPWLYAGAALAAVLVVPNLMWQAAHGWPSVEFYRNADLYKNVATPPVTVLAQQVLFVSPAALPVWLAGLWYFLRARAGRPYRHFGWLYLALLALMVVAQKSRPDRIIDAYLVLFAGGGAALGHLVQQARWRWVRWGLPAAMVLAGAVLAPIGLPLLPPATAARYASALGVVPQIESGEGKRTALPQWLADRQGWETLVADVGRVAATLSPDERARAIILAPSYGHAGAVEWLGRDLALPPVFATQNSYHEWGPPPESATVAIVIGPISDRRLGELFVDVRKAAMHDCDWCMPWRDRQPIWIARGLRRPWREAWPGLKHYE